MKITLPENYKRFLTIADMENLREIRQQMKEENLEELAQMAARVASGSNYEFEILKSSAEIAKNSRIYNAFTENSAELDVWIEIYAYNRHEGFFDLGVYITDLWQVDGYNNDEIRSHMFLKEFRKK